MASVPDLWDSVFGQHVEVVRAVMKGNWDEIYVALEEELQAVVKAIRSESLWTLPIVYTVCNSLKKAAIEADRHGSRTEHMQSAGGKLMAAFSALGDRKSDGQSKKAGAMKVVCIMFDIYFRLNNYRLCAPLTKILEGPGYRALSDYPVSHLVTYRFFTGRLQLFEGRYADAETDLAFCFESIPASRSERNKRLALMFLVPAKLMRGRLPQTALLTRYRLPEYQGLAESMRTGNLALFDATVAQNEALFRKRGLYLLLGSLRWLVYRTLFKRTYLMVHKINSPPVCSLAALQCALAASAAPMDVDEVECLVANLIFSKLIRGYMATQRGQAFVIFSQTDPFPSIGSAFK